MLLGDNAAGSTFSLPLFSLLRVPTRAERATFQYAGSWLGISSSWGAGQNKRKVPTGYPVPLIHGHCRTIEEQDRDAGILSKPATLGSRNCGHCIIRRPLRNPLLAASDRHTSGAGLSSIGPLPRIVLSDSLEIDEFPGLPYCFSTFYGKTTFGQILHYRYSAAVHLLELDRTLEIHQFQTEAFVFLYCHRALIAFNPGVLCRTIRATITSSRTSLRRSIYSRDGHVISKASMVDISVPLFRNLSKISERPKFHSLDNQARDRTFPNLRRISHLHPVPLWRASSIVSDHFTIIGVVRRLPILPCIGHARTLFEPLARVASAARTILKDSFYQISLPTVEYGGSDLVQLDTRKRLVVSANIQSTLQIRNEHYALLSKYVHVHISPLAIMVNVVASCWFLNFYKLPLSQHIIVPCIVHPS
ncbi:uncharacterized protein BDR25DRAFT_349497 [Lindgomyces ingoldianus]|uniref:Uncharacterized protein n=1 Tax=Lindgomyces ingoldianus TaxID=673940 RepID=A0ACB6RBG5_9PLEO|nr:uncharacterized protein BDR25DRAFT_349497 [Lindgomyces ingoldianus]KAF2476385.1 hypothetical protein BDR25DRAFT_349497 [Lindgomyces ingoldianus]